MAYDPGLDEIASMNYGSGATPSTDRGLDEIAGMFPATPKPATAAPNPDQNRSALGDFGTAFGIGVEQLPGAVAGIADIVNPMVRVDPNFSAVKAATALGEATGFQPGKWAQEKSADYSPEHQQYLKELQGTKGFLPTLAKHVANPLQSAVQLTESLPAMLLPGGVVRGAASKLALGATGRLIGAGAGEGAMMGGQMTQQLIDQGVDPGKAANVGAVDAVVGGAMGVGGGALARRLGLNDLDVVLAGGGRAVREGAEAAPQTWKQGLSALVGRVVEGAAVEGGFEELPQSVMEQMLQNHATGKPILEGVPEAGATGFALGALAGGGMNVPGARHQVDMTTGADTSTPTAESALQAALRRTKTDNPATTPADAKARAKYEKDLAAAFDEPSGFRVTDENGVERELTNFEYYYREATGEMPPVAKPEEAPFGDQFRSFGGTNNNLRTELNNAQSTDEVLELIRTAAENKTSSKNFAAMDALHAQLTGQTLEEWKSAQDAPTTGRPFDDWEVADQYKPDYDAAIASGMSHDEAVKFALDKSLNPQGVANGSQETQPVRESAEQVRQGQGGNAEARNEGAAQGSTDGGRYADEGQNAAQGNADDAQRRGGQEAQQKGLTDAKKPDVSIAAASGAQLPAVQQKVFDHMVQAAQDNRLDEVVDAAGVVQYAAIAKALGIKRGSVKVAVDGAMRNIAKAQGLTVEQFKEALRTRTAAVRTTEASTEDQLGLNPSAQSSEVDMTSLFGNEDGAEQNMEIVSSAGQTNANANSDAMDAGNKEGTDFLREAGAMTGRNEVVVPETRDPVAERRAAEAKARYEATVEQVLAAPWAAEAAQEWDDFKADSSPSAAELDRDTAYEWTLEYGRMKHGDLTANALTEIQRNLERDLAGRRVAGSLPQRAGVDSRAALTDQRPAGESKVGESTGEARQHPQRLAAETQAQAEPAEAGLTAAHIEQQWDAASDEHALPQFKHLSEEQRNFLLGSETQEEFNDAAQEVANELTSEVSDDLTKNAQFSEGETSGAEATAVRETLRKLFLTPARFDALVTVVQNAGELPAGAKDAMSSAKGKVQGFVMGRRVYLIADHIQPGRELAVFLHELGVHQGLKNLIGATNFGRLVGQVRAWSKTTGTTESRLATKALLRAVKSSSQSDEEVVAYFVEEAVNAGINPQAVTQGSTGFRTWFRTLWAGVKATLRKIGFQRFDQLKAQNIVDLAYGAANLELHGTWHGTAADFRRFDHSYMGSGEGAQVYGWGTYLAQRHGIAKGYFEADIGRKSDVTFNGTTYPINDAEATYDKLLSAVLEAFPNSKNAAYEVVENVTNGMTPEQVVRRARSGAFTDEAFAKQVEEIASSMSAQGPDGALMRVVPQVEDDELLDWDKPLAEQSEKVKAALDADDTVKDALNTDRPSSVDQYIGGQELYGYLERELGSDKAASKHLNSLGIKGIKFLDAQSRGNGRTVGGFPKLAELTQVLRDNDMLGFESRAEVLQAVVQDGMVEMRRNFDLPVDVDQLLTEFVDWVERPPETATRNLVIFNDRNLLRVASRIAADADRVKFSEANTTRAIINNVPEKLRPSLKRVATHVKEAFRTATELTMFTEDLVRTAEKLFPGGFAKRWYAELAKREQTRMEHKARVDDIAVKFDQLDRSQFTRTWKLIHDMTSSQLWAYKPAWKSDAMVDGELAKQYNLLSATEQGLVDEVFKHGDDTIKRIKSILDEVVKSEKEAALARATNDHERQRIEKAFEGHAKLFDTTLSELDGPYAPMKRVGSHVVVAKSQAYLDAEQNDHKALYAMRRQPEHYWVQFADSLAEAQAIRDEIAPKYAFSDAAVKEKVTGTEGLPFEAFDKIRKMIAAEGQDGAKEASTTVKKLSSLVTELYLTALAETSARKSQLRRDNIGGMDVERVGPDAMYRAFLSKGTADAHYIGTLQNGRAVAEAFAGMRREANAQGGDRHGRRRLFNELSTRYDNSLKYDSSPLVSKLMNLGSVWMLLTKPAYFLYNATQPVMLTQPALAQKHGYAKSGVEMLRAYKELVGLKSFTSMTPIDLHTLPQDVRAAVLELRDRGRIDITITQDLGERIHGATGTVGRAWQTSERFMKSLAQKVETTNRVVSAVAAFRLAKASGLSDKAAIDYASDIIYDTHGDYSNLNAPRLMNQTQAQRLLFQFRKFQFIQIGQLVRMSKEAMKGKTLEEKWAMSKALRYTLAHHAVLAGAMGLPAASVIAMMLSAGADDDRPFDPEFEAYKAIGNPTIAALLLHGLPAVFDLNLSRNIGMGQTFSVLPFADVRMGEKGGYEKLVTAATGPVIGGMGSQLWDAVGAMQQGDVYKGLEAILPSGLRAVAKAFREALDGVENKAGDTLVNPDEIDAWQTGLKVAGFKTESDAVRQLMRGAQYEYEKQFSERTTVLKKQYREAYRDNDAAAMAEARTNWQEMQSARRMMGFKTQPLSEMLKAPMEQRKRERNTRAGLQFNHSNRNFVQSLEE